MAVERPAIARQVLEHPSAGVGGLDQDEHARRPGHSHVDKRLQAVVAQIGADGQGVGPPRALASQVALGVGRSRGADVVAFAVEDDQQPLLAGVLDDLGQRRHSRRPELFEEGRLRLDYPHQRGNYIDNLAAELAVGRRRFGRPGLRAVRGECRGQHIARGSRPTRTGFPQRRTAASSWSEKGSKVRFLGAYSYPKRGAGFIHAVLLARSALPVVAAGRDYPFLAYWGEKARAPFFRGKRLPNWVRSAILTRSCASGQPGVQR